MNTWAKRRGLSIDPEAMAELVREIERLRAEHPAPCELFLTSQGRCACG